MTFFIYNVSDIDRIKHRDTCILSKLCMNIKALNYTSHSIEFLLLECPEILESKGVPWQRKPWCKRPLRYLWHLSHFSSTLKLCGMRLCVLLLTLLLGQLTPKGQPESTATLGLGAVASAEPVVSVATGGGGDGWQSSSMHTKMFFWWNSSFIPIFCNGNHTATFPETTDQVGHFPITLVKTRAYLNGGCKCVRI